MTGAFVPAAARAERRLSAEMAAHARGRTLVLGAPIEGLLEALWERTSVAHVPFDPIDEVVARERAKRLGIADYERLTWDAASVRAWESVFFRADLLPKDMTPGLGSLVSAGAELHEIVLASGEGLFARRPRAPIWLNGAGLPWRQLPLPAATSSHFASDLRGVTISAPRRADVTAPPKSHVSVTVVMATAGRSPWLRAAIESALGQTHSPASVVLVSDDGGDEVRAIAGAFGSSVRFIEQAQAGQAAALNAGIAVVDTDYVALLDDDDLFLPRKLELQLADLGTHPEAVLSATDHYVIDEDGRVLDRRSAPVVERSRLKRFLLSGSHVLGPSAVIRTGAVRSLGPSPFDASLRRAADHALWFELADRGEFRAYPLALSMIRRHASNRESTERTRLVWESTKQTIGRAIRRWTLEEFYPEIIAATDEAERTELRVLARLERAGHLIRVGLLADALADVDAGLTERGGDARLLHFRAVALLESGSLEESRVAFEDAARAGAPAVEVACGLGTIAYWQGDRERARTAFRRACAADPRSLLARYNLALIEESPDAARGLARDALSLLRLPGFLLSPAPPLEGLEAEFVRLRRTGQDMLQ